MIWCVEDDEGIREIEVYTLRSTGFEAEGFAGAEEFFAALSVRRPQLVLLDVMLPGTDGIETLKKLRASPSTASLPVIMATAKGMEYDRINGLDLGADDYLVKPFGMMEMVARVRAVLRRCGTGVNEERFSFGGLKLDGETHTVTADGVPAELTLKEFGLLRLLMSHPGTVFTRDRLLSDVWGVEYAGETRTVDVHIRTLRAKLGSCGTLICTVRGVGYKLGAEA